MNEKVEPEVIVDCGSANPLFYKGIFAKMMNQLLFAEDSIWLKDVVLTVENNYFNGKIIKHIQVEPNSKSI